MSESERWAKSQEQIDRMHTARVLCGWCGRELADDETVYFELFAVGVKRPRYLGGAQHRAYAFARVGAECASSDLLQQTKQQAPDPCARCGRGVVYRATRSTRQQASCSRRCDRRLGQARRRERTRED